MPRKGYKPSIFHKQNISEGVKKSLPSTVFQKGQPSWNKGLKGFIHKGHFKKDNIPWITGKHHSEETKKKISLLKKGKKNPCVKTNPQIFKKGQIPWNKNKKCTQFSGKNHWNWQGGISSDKRYYQRYNRIKRRKHGLLSIGTIQLVYEDNIKKYGTLTCYLCLKLIEFGKDCIEHKIPLSRGGANEYSNLAIACRSCNSKKHSKTEEEYRKVIL